MSEKLFKESWRIADSGIAALDEDQDKFKLVRKADIETKNTQVREWRQIEHVTTHYLIKLFRRRRDKLADSKMQHKQQQLQAEDHTLGQHLTTNVTNSHDQQQTETTTIEINNNKDEVK